MSNYTFTFTIGAGPSNPNNLTMLLPKEGYQDFPVTDNRLIPILDELIAESVEKANLYFDGCCVGHVELELYQTDLAIFGRVKTMGGETLFIKLLSEEKPDTVMMGGLKYYPQFKDIYDCGEYPGIATGAFFSHDDIFSLNIKSLKGQSSTFHVDGEKFADNYSSLEEFFIEPDDDGYTIALGDQKLCRVLGNERNDYLNVSIRLIDLVNPHVIKILKAMGFEDETKIEHQFHHFVQNDAMTTTLGQYMDFIRQHVID
jgi:hypothetical protein